MNGHALKLLTVTLLALAAACSAKAQSCDLNVLNADHRDLLPSMYRDGLQDPGPNQLLLIREVAAVATPLQCAAVSNVAFVDDRDEADDGVLGWVMANSHQSLLHVNAAPGMAAESLLASARPEIRANIWQSAVETLLHETVHNTVHLLDTQLAGDTVGCLAWDLFCDEPTDSSQWSAEAVSLAGEATERMRLRGGVLAEWTRIHDAFVAVSWAEAHSRDAVPSYLPEAGFMSSYGSTSPGEDLAEMAALAATHGRTRLDSIDLPLNRGSPPAQACVDLNNSAGSITNDNAAIFTKLNFLRDLGLLSEAGYSACVGGTALGVPDADGFHMSIPGQPVNHFDSGLEVRMGTFGDGGPIVFEFAASGTVDFLDQKYPATMRLRLTTAPAGTPIDIVSWPRGVYMFHESTASLRMTVPDAPAASFDAVLGFVLVTSASGRSIEGAVNIQRAMRWGAPIPVPMAEDSLPSIRFRVTSGR